MGREIPPLSPTETAVFYAVARYRFISVELLLRVVDATRGTIRDAAHRLHVFGLLGSTAPKRHKFDPHDPAARREFGKPSLFWVSDKGAAYLDELREDDPAAPWVLGSKRKPDDREGREDAHRLGIVAIHIAFRAWAEATGKTGVSFLCDFEPGVATKATKVPYPGPNGEEWSYNADGFARFRLTPEGHTQLMVIEFERGGRAYDLSPFFTSKLAGISFAARHELVERYKARQENRHVPTPPYLIVFATEAMRRKALADWPDPAAPAWGQFFVKSLPEIEAKGADFSRGWWRISGGQRDLYAAARASSPDRAAPPSPVGPNA